MKCALDGDDFASAVLVQGAVSAREFYRAFVGFRAGIGKEHLVEAAASDQRLGELEAGGVVKRRARRQQPFCLFGERLGDFRRRMAEAIDRPPLDEVEIALAAVVPKPRAFAAHEYGRRARRDVHQRIERMGGIGHVELLWGCDEKWAKREKAALLRVRPSRKRC